MASESLFSGIPSFPDSVPTAEISSVSLTQLIAGNANTVDVLFKACHELGFFLLDLRNDPLGDAIVEEIDRLFGVTEEFMRLSKATKDAIFKRFYPERPWPQGQSKTETKEPDRFEWFNLAQDGLLGNTPVQPLPDIILSHRHDYTSFVRHGQYIVSLICETLATKLQLPRSAFTSLSLPSKPSGTVIRMIRYDPSPKSEDPRTSMLDHTDIGNVTLLANVLGGLQILRPNKDPKEEDAWLWVRPQARHLIVNIGDAMVQWSGGILRSNVHRVIHAPGEQRYLERFSLALLVRAEKEAIMKSLIRAAEDSEGHKDPMNKDEELTAWKWEVKRTAAMINGEPVLSKGGRPIVDA